MASSRSRRARPGTRWAVLAPLLCTLSCSWVLDNCGSSRAIIRELNGAQQTGPSSEVSSEVREHLHTGLVDSYWTYWVGDPAFPFDAARGTGPVTDALLCLFKARHPGSLTVPNQERCLSALDDALGLSRAAAFGTLEAREGPTDAVWQREEDAVRLSTVLGQTLVGLVGSLESSEPYAVPFANGESLEPGLADQVREGVRQGLTDFISYQANRSVHRSRQRRTTALVLSGGAANGAYSAGAVWWLLHELDRCRATGGCQQDLVDMAAGTSTGCLIATVIADYFSRRPRARKSALDLLTQSYLCSTSSDLYCLVPVGASNLGVSNARGRATGLVRFHKLMKILEDNATEDTLRSPVEMFASTVDFQSGHLYELSSRDRLDIPDPATLRFAILGSVVEPFMSEPIYAIGRLRGLFMDGGVRSGLPMTPVLLGGAEAVLSFVNEPPEPRILAKPPQNGLQIADRALSLFSHQPIEGELEESELLLAYRRELEYEHCLARLAANRAAEVLKEAYCANEDWPGQRATDALGGARSSALAADSARPRSLRQIYHASRFFEPEVTDPEGNLRLPPLAAGAIPVDANPADFSAPGYAFDPRVMWNIFVLGAGQAQERCAEARDVLGWHIPCASDDFASTLRELHELLTAAGCYRKSLAYVTCPSSAHPLSVPPLPQAVIH